ncbi:MAG: YdcF family protein [Acidobacteria bacterium]|nr:YdcF family protein [Acidobacteriota bacterium]MCU0254173.1 YdcF family protein [Acidobacteriota bacterium]
MRELVTTPLGIAFLAGLAAVLLAWRRWRRGAAPGAPCVLLVASWTLVMTAAAPPVAWLLESSLARLGERWPPPPPAEAPPEGILVFGGGLEGTGPEAPLSASSAERLLAALTAAGRWPDAVVVFSGGPGRPGRVGVAQRMAEEAARLGLPGSRIVVEPKARTTRENAVHSAAEARDRGWRRVALVTSPVHLARARASLAREGFLALPAGPLLGDPGRWDAADLLPSAAALDRTTGALHEAIGLTYYGLRGWLAAAPPAATAPAPDAAARPSPR